MNKEQLIEKLNLVTKYPDSFDQYDIFASNTIRDFVDHDFENGSDEYYALRQAVERVITDTLSKALDSENEKYGENEPEERVDQVIWERWTNDEIDADFSEIKNILDEYLEVVDMGIDEPLTY